MGSKRHLLILLDSVWKKSQTHKLYKGQSTFHIIRGPFPTNLTCEITNNRKLCKYIEYIYPSAFLLYDSTCNSILYNNSSRSERNTLRCDLREGRYSILTRHRKAVAMFKPTFSHQLTSSCLPGSGYGSYWKKSSI